VATILINLVTDLVCASLDPRLAQRHARTV
jgi:ABC-type dipeptide/oligopeptide/nickel transport system permease component